MVRFYRTKKPEVGIVSKFYGGYRVQDRALRDYLLNLELPNPQAAKATGGKGPFRKGTRGLNTDNKLPESFRTALEQDRN